MFESKTLSPTKKQPIRISFEIPNRTFFNEKDLMVFEESICKIIKEAVSLTARNVSENMLFEEFQQQVKNCSKNTDFDDARRMVIEAMTLTILLNNLR